MIECIKCAMCNVRLPLDICASVTMTNKPLAYQFVYTIAYILHSQLCNIYIYEQENFASVKERESLQMLHDSYMYQHQRYRSVIKKPSNRAIFTKLRLNCSQLSTFPFQKIDYKECIYCSNKIADIEHVLLECREIKCLRDAYLKTMNDKCCEFRFAENKNEVTMMLELKFDVKKMSMLLMSLSQVLWLLWIAYTCMYRKGSDL